MESERTSSAPLAIGSISLGSVPRIAVPITDECVEERLATARRWADIAELRVDMCGELAEDHIAAVSRTVRDAAMPLLVTVRCSRQGGAAALSNERRIALYRAAAPFADAVDVEIQSPIFDAVLDLATDRNLTTIASHHDFRLTPPDAELVELLERARSSGADIAKVAVTANSADDRNRLLDLLRSRAEQPMIAIAMGDHGAASRVFFPLCGSLVTYGFLGESVAPGQLSIQELRRELERYCPRMSGG